MRIRLTASRAPHDWYDALARWGLLEHDTRFARWMRMIALLMCVASLAVALWSALHHPREHTAEALPERVNETDP